METYLYLSLIPESLIVSMLPPSEFGTYLAVGTKKRAHGQAIFFSLKGLDSEAFNLQDIDKLCVPHEDGEPKHSVYLAIYRVLERIPFSAINTLHLVTQDGRVLEIEPQGKLPEFSQKYHLYQELCPVNPRIASTLNPEKFIKFITDENQNIHVPKICFVDLRLGEIAQDPEHGSLWNLPYHSVEHLRACLIELRDNSKKLNKTVDRLHSQYFPYRIIKNGIFLGSKDEILFYPFPAKQELETKYYEWWHSASIMGE